MPSFYRVECKYCKLGPYTCGCIKCAGWEDTKYEMIGEHCDMLHPTISNDYQFSSYEEMSKYICGFRHESDLRKWFEGYLETLLDYGFEIVVREVKQALQGRSKIQWFCHKENWECSM